MNIPRHEHSDIPYCTDNYHQVRYNKGIPTIDVMLVEIPTGKSNLKAKKTDVIQLNANIIKCTSLV